METEGPRGKGDIGDKGDKERPKVIEKVRELEADTGVKGDTW